MNTTPNVPAIPADLLIPKDVLGPQSLFTTEGAMDSLVEAIRKQAHDDNTFDMTTKEGRDGIKSLAYRVARSKTFIVEMSKEYIKPMDDKIKTARAATKSMESKLDELRDEIRDPVTKFEAQEEERINEIKDRMGRFDLLTKTDETTTSDQLVARLDELAMLFDFDWQEYEDIALKAYNRVKDVLETKHQARVQHEEDQKELERLRAEQAAEKEELEQLRKEKREREAAEAAAKVEVPTTDKIEVTQGDVQTVDLSTGEILSTDDDGTPGTPHPPAEQSPQLELGKDYTEGETTTVILDTPEDVETTLEFDMPPLLDRIQAANQFVSVMQEAQPGNEHIYRTLLDALAFYAAHNLKEEEAA